MVEGLLDNISTNTVVAFTDGSCKGSPGPCGAGSCIILSNIETVELKQPVSKLASILLGELVAIKIILDFILEEKTRCQIDSIMIFSDSQTSVGILQLGWENKTHKKTSSDIQQIMNDLLQAGTEVKIQWSPGQADIPGNETADRLAKETAKEAEDMLDYKGETSQAEVKHGAREAVIIKWQRRWEVSEKGRDLFQLKQKVKLKNIHVGFQTLNK